MFAYSQMCVNECLHAYSIFILKRVYTYESAYKESNRWMNEKMNESIKK